jgi:hypothetical protein
MIGSLFSRVRGSAKSGESSDDTDSSPTDECPDPAPDSEATDDSDADDAAYEVQPNQQATTLPTPGESHQSMLGPADIERRPTAIRTGQRWAQTLWVGEFPDTPMDGLFQNLYATAETRNTDISLHITPRDTHATLDSLKNQIEELEADLEYLREKRRAGARGVQRDLEDYRNIYDTLRNTSMEAFDVAMYLTVRGETPEELPTETVRNTARQAPANLTPFVPRWAQLDALVAASPVGLDTLADHLETTTPMLGAAVGSMFPFVAGSLAEPGIEYGTYALNGSPLILDRFNRETGYCMLTIGKLGAGKSFGTKLQLVRRAMYDRDTILIMLDPLEGFAGVNQALGGERVTVGGTRGFNPLEIKPTPPALLERVPDLDPWSEQITWVLTFFETFFTHVANSPLGDRKQTLRRAVQETYERNGITPDPSTHDAPSPTVRDVIDVLEHILETPGDFGYTTPGEQDRVQSDAQSLLIDLRPSFREGGDLSNLAQPTEFDLDEDVIYLDLHQEEGARGRTETSLMMQVLFNAVYERAKQTDKRVVFAIDEAHYLLNDSTSLDFLETAVRHSRHYDISLQFVTQTGGEFTLTPEARTIANLCSMTVIHRVDEAADQLAEWFGLSERQVNWVRSAKAGNDDDGYSEALLGVDEEGWFPMRIRASEYEAEVLDTPTDTP